jgi:hypothetical protein
MEPIIRDLLDALHRCNMNLLLPRHINLLLRWPNFLFMCRFTESAFCLVYLFTSWSKACCNCTPCWNSSLFVFQVPILSCLGLIHLYYIRPICVISVVVFLLLNTLDNRNSISFLLSSGRFHLRPPLELRRDLMVNLISSQPSSVFSNTILAQDLLNLVVFSRISNYHIFSSNRFSLSGPNQDSVILQL